MRQFILFVIALMSIVFQGDFAHAASREQVMTQTPYWGYIGREQFLNQIPAGWATISREVICNQTPEGATISQDVINNQTPRAAQIGCDQARLMGIKVPNCKR